MTIICSKCSLSVCSWKDYTTHLRSAHSLHWCGSVVVCGQDGCPRQFTTFNSLRWHLFNKHPDVIEDVDSALSETVPHMHTADDCCMPDSDAESIVEPECMISMPDIAHEFSQVMADFACKLQAQSSANMKLVDEVIQMVGTLVQQIVEPVSEHLLKLLKRDSPDVDKAVTLVSEFETLPRIVDSFRTEHKRLKLLTDNGFYVEPKECVVGTRREHKFSSRRGFAREVTVEDKVYFVPLDALLSVIFRSERVQNLLVVQSNENDSQIKHLSDGLLYKSHPLYKAHPDSLVLHMYIDAYETTNPLGSHTGLHKMEALYMIIQNFPSFLVSKVSQIYTLAVWNALDSKNYGYDKVLMPVLAMLKQLESDLGLPVSINGKIVHMHGSVLVFSADNLGAHSFCGFLESFSARKCCRFCEATKDEVQTVYNENQFCLRTRQSFDETVASLSACNYDQSLTGIKGSCCFHQLKYFHVTENWAPDIMHDLLEGVAPYECSLLLQTLEMSGLLTVEVVNAAVQSFMYSACDRKSKPPSLTTFSKLNMKAADMWCFVRILPVIIGPLVPRKHDHWELFLMLRDIMDIVFAPVITVGMTDYLRCLIEDHHRLFAVCYPSQAFLPKHHFMVHYPTAILRVGPLSHIWTMRFEAKHQFAKTAMKSTFCFKNVAKTIAKRTQLELAYSAFTDSLYRFVVETGPGSWSVLASLDADVANLITADIGLQREDEVYIANWLRIGHYKFLPGAAVVIDVVEGIPTFGRIHVLFSGVDNSTLYIVIEVLEVVCFDRHVYSYHITAKSDSSLKLIQPADLYDVHPLSVQTVVYEGQQCDLVYPRYRLF